MCIRDRTNAEVTSQMEQEDLTSHIRRRRAAVFGHEKAPGRMAMQLAVDTWDGGRSNNNPHWKRRPERPRHTWVRQVEIDTGTSADVAWDTAVDRCSWRALRPQLVKRDRLMMMTMSAIMVRTLHLRSRELIVISTPCQIHYQDKGWLSTNR